MTEGGATLNNVYSIFSVESPKMRDLVNPPKIFPSPGRLGFFLVPLLYLSQGERDVDHTALMEAKGDLQKRMEEVSVFVCFVSASGRNGRAATRCVRDTTNLLHIGQITI